MDERNTFKADLEAARRALAAETEAKATAVARAESVLKLEAKGLAEEVYVATHTARLWPHCAQPRLVAPRTTTLWPHPAQLRLGRIPHIYT